MAEESWKKYIADQATLKEVRDMIANGRVVKNVQRGTFNMLGASTGIRDVVLAEVNLSKCDITYNGFFTAIGTNDIPTYQIYLASATSTLLRFQCPVVPSSVAYVSWQVVEYY